jgi:hypothetical protein
VGLDRHTSGARELHRVPDDVLQHLIEAHRVHPDPEVRVQRDRVVERQTPKLRLQSPGRERPANRLDQSNGFRLQVDTAMERPLEVQRPFAQGEKMRRGLLHHRHQFGADALSALHELQPRRQSAERSPQFVAQVGREAPAGRVLLLDQALRTLQYGPGVAQAGVGNQQRTDDQQRACQPERTPGQHAPPGNPDIDPQLQPPRLEAGDLLGRNRIHGAAQDGRQLAGRFPHGEIELAFALGHGTDGPQGALVLGLDQGVDDFHVADGEVGPSLTDGAQHVRL